MISDKMPKINILLTELLNLPGVIVEEWQQTETELIFPVEIETEFANCPHCQEVSKNLHANTSYWVRDLPLSNREVWLKVNRRKLMRTSYHDGKQLYKW